MKFLRVYEVSEVVGYSISHIWRMARDGTFPQPIKLGPNATGWIDTEIGEGQRVRVDQRSGDQR